MAEPDVRQDLEHPPPDFRTFRIRDLQRERDIIVDIPVFEQPEVLEDDPQRPAKFRNVTSADRRRVVFADQDRSIVGEEVEIHEPQERRLSTAVSSNSRTKPPSS